MATYDEVSQFLKDFKVKLEIFQIYFLDYRSKNKQGLLDLEITSSKRIEIIKDLLAEDYC